MLLERSFNRVRHSDMAGRLAGAFDLDIIISSASCRAKHNASLKLGILAEKWNAEGWKLNFTLP